MTDTANTVDGTTSHMSESLTTSTEVTLSDTDTTTTRTERTAESGLREAVFTEEPRPSRPDQSAHGEKSGYRKVVVVGPPRAGKSSLINLLTNNKYKILTNGDARRVTFGFQGYLVPDRNIELIDTIGIGEVDTGAVSHLQCLENLIQMLRNLDDGLNLFVFVRPNGGGRIHLSSDQINYDIFIDTMGRGRIPSLFVVTGCENLSDMLDWGPSNKHHFDEAGLRFTAIISGTCLSEGPFAKTAEMADLRQQTKDAVWEAIEKNISAKPIKLSMTPSSSLQAVVKNTWNGIFRNRHFPGANHLLLIDDQIVELFRRAGFDMENARRLASFFSSNT